MSEQQDNFSIMTSRKIKDITLLETGEMSGPYTRNFGDKTLTMIQNR